MTTVVQIPNLPSAIALSGSEEMELVQAGVSVRATVAQVVAEAHVPPPSSTLPLMDGVAAAGGAYTFSRGDHVHPSDTSRVAKSGDTMTGSLVISHADYPSVTVNTTNPAFSPSYNLTVGDNPYFGLGLTAPSQDFVVTRYDATSAWNILSNPLQISYATGTTTLTGLNARIEFTGDSGGLYINGNQWPGLYLAGSDGTSPGMAFGTGPVGSYKTMWELWPDDPVSQGGTNDFWIIRHNDAGAVLDHPVVISYATGAVSFTAIPTAPTALTGDNSTKLATTAFVKAQGYVTAASLGTMAYQNANAVAITGGAINSTPIGATTASTGAFTNLAASGTVSGAGFTTLLTPYALINSQVFTGTPSLPTGTIGVTQAPGDSSTKLATTAFVGAATTALGLGTMAVQNANAVAITGGAINGTTVGATTRASGAFTTLAANGAATFTSSLTASPASANVTFSPTGTGTVTINPATLGAIDNMAVGATTPSTGKFTTLSATSINSTPIGPTTPSTGAFTTLSASGTATFTGALTASPANANVTLSPTGTGTVTIGPATLGTINNMTIGATTAAAGTFTNLTATGTVSGAGFTTLLTPYALVNSQVFTGTPSLPTGTIGVTQAAATNNTTLATTAYVKSQNYLTGNQTITHTGDATGSGTTSIPMTVVALQGRPLAATAPTTGYYMGWNGSTWLPVAPGSAAAGGTNTQIQYNNGGLLGGISQNGSGTVVMTTGAAAVVTSNTLGILGAAANDAAFTLNRPAGQKNILYGQTAGSLRWSMTLGDVTAEGGSNAGSDFNISRYTDAGGALDSPLKIVRSTGVATFAQALFSANHTVTGAAGNNAAVIINKAAAGFYSGIETQTAGSRRWLVMPGDNTAEGGSNAGSDFLINRYSDTAVFIDTAFKIIRSTGAATFSQTLTSGNHTINNANPAFTLNKAASGGVNAIIGNTNALQRWTMHLGGSTSETGSNNGSDFIIWRANDAGSTIDAPMAINRSTGQAYFSQTLNAQNGLTIQYADPVILMNKSSTGHGNNIYGQTAGVSRWGLVLGDASAESTGNAGSDFDIARFADNGAFIDNVLSINRASGQATFSKNVLVNGGALSVAPASGAANAYLIKSASGQSSTLWGQKGATTRWSMELGTSAAESTGNVGSDFALSRYNDAGTFIDSPLIVTRATGAVTINGGTALYGNSIELGAPAQNAPSFIDFHSSASSTDYDARIISSGGTAGVGGGALSFVAATAGVTGTFGVSGALTCSSSITGQNIFGSGLYSSSGQMFCQSSAAENYINVCDTSGNGGQYRNMTIRGLDATYTAEATMGIFSVRAATMRNYAGTVDGWAGTVCRQGPYGAVNGDYTLYWNNANLECRIGSVYVGYVSLVSDYRIKKDVAPLPSMWDRVKTLNPISYTHKDYTPPEGSRTESGARAAPTLLIAADDQVRWGFIAHELQETLVESAATGQKDEADTLQSPNPWTVIATLTKALQEAMTRIEALEARP